MYNNILDVKDLENFTQDKLIELYKQGYELNKSPKSVAKSMSSCTCTDNSVCVSPFTIPALFLTGVIAGYLMHKPVLGPFRSAVSDDYMRTLKEYISESKENINRIQNELAYLLSVPPGQRTEEQREQLLNEELRTETRHMKELENELEELKIKNKEVK